MSVESVARDFVSNMTDVNKTKAALTPDAMASGGILPAPMPAMDAFNLVNGLTAGLPDLKFSVQQVTVNGNQATVNALISGTHTGTLNMPMPGMPLSIPVTGKKVSVKDTFVVTVQGDKVSHLQVNSPADGGIPAVLAQLGVKMPNT